MKVLRIPESPHTALETAVWTIYAPDSLPSRRQVGSGCAAWLHLPLGSQPSAPIVFSAQPFPESGSDGASLVLVLHMPSWWLLILPIPFFVNRPFIKPSSIIFLSMLSIFLPGLWLIPLTSGEKHLWCLFWFTRQIYIWMILQLDMKQRLPHSLMDQLPRHGPVIFVGTSPLGKIMS